MSKYLAIAALILSSSAFAQVYKCPAPGGKILYSDMPCTGGVSTGIQNVQSEARPYDPANDPNARAAAILQADREAKDAVRARERQAIVDAREEKRAKAIQEATLRELQRGNDINERKLFDPGLRTVTNPTLRCRPTGNGNMECQ